MVFVQSLLLYAHGLGIESMEFVNLCANERISVDYFMIEYCNNSIVRCESQQAYQIS